MTVSRFFYLNVFLLLLVSVTKAQVSLQTGSANFSIPMFEWKDDKSRLFCPVTLFYSSGTGLNVNQPASNIGQGWNMLAGGVVSRIQVGEPDDQQAYNATGSPHDIRKYPAGYLYASEQPQKGCPDALTRYPVFPAQNMMYKVHNVVAEDKQPDYFSFQFNGKSGMFVLDKTNNTGISIGDNKLKISFTTNASLANGTNTGIRTIINAFSIQDVDGLIYRFSTLSTTKVLETQYCDATLMRQTKQPKFENNKVYHQNTFDNATFINPFVTDSWYLTEIEDVFTGRKIRFNYTVRNINARAGEDISYNQDKNYSIVTHKRSVNKVPDIDSVVYPDGHKVVFNYGKPRADMNGGYVMENVSVLYKSRYISQYELGNTYFILNRYGTPVTNYQKSVSRLCLTSVKKTGVDLREDTPPYIFDYYTGSNAADDFVPPTFFYARDIWGYYNGNNSAGVNNESIPLNLAINIPITALNNNQLRGLCFQRSGSPGPAINPKEGYAKNGLLKQIIYPTGGTLNYEYGQNRGNLGGTEQNVAGVHVSKTSATDGGGDNDCNNPLATNYHYVVNGPSSASSMWGLEMPVNTNSSSVYYKAEHKKFIWKPSCLFGCCEYKDKYPGITAISQKAGINWGGLVSELISETLGVISFLKTTVNVLLLTGVATGGVASIAALVIDIIAGVVTLVLTCFVNQPAQITATTMWFNANLNNMNPLPAQFKRVEVIENPGTIGKTVHQFTSADDYPLWNTNNLYNSNKQRYAPWAYGLPKLVTAYDANGYKVKEVENIYDQFNIKKLIKPCGDAGQPPCDNPSGLVLSNLVGCKCDVKKTYSQRSTHWTDPGIYNAPASYKILPSADMGVDMYGLYTGRVQLSTTKERLFKPNDNTNYVETVTDFGYDYVTYELRNTRTIKSNGDDVRTYLTFSRDYSTGILNTFNTNNMQSVPVAKTTWQYKAGSGTDTYLSEEVNEYTQLTNGDIKLARTLEQSYDKPEAYPVWATYNGPGAPGTNYAKYRETQTFSYDAVTGNLTGAKDLGNRQLSNIYDYDDKYAVATVINAHPVNDKPAYTSFETDKTGGWTLSGTPAYNTTYAATGARSLSLSGITLWATLNSSKPYILSFWASNPVSVSGASLVKSAPVKAGLTYYEYNVPQGTGTVYLWGSGYMDELRVYPADARMRTTTYDPVIGKTSECDENNRITYYTYDNLGRLQFVKDDNRNIVKMYEYNNISPARQNGCPAVYYNRQVSEMFTRDCGPGYLPGSVAYTVPANTYSSAISQADADAKAELLLLTNGQNYANTYGTCTLLYYNTAQSRTDTTQSCPPGYKGGSVTYTVPAGTYASTVSVADANQMALEDIEANSKAYANDPANAVCIYTTDADWEWDNETYNCQDVGGERHLFVQERDMNPNSATYNTTRWSDTGPNAELCPVATIYARLEMVFSYNFTGGENCLDIDFYDIYVRFYSDAACTTPVSVSNLTIAWRLGTTMPLTTKLCNGTSTYLTNYALKHCSGCGTPTCYYMYPYIEPGAGYTVTY